MNMNPQQLNVAKDISYQMSQCIQRNDNLKAWALHKKLEEHFKRCDPPTDKGLFEHVIYWLTDNGEKLTKRDHRDELFIVKVKDYIHPIPCFKHIPKESGKGSWGPFIHYYQARGDGVITATYTDTQIEWENSVNVQPA